MKTYLFFSFEEEEETSEDYYSSALKLNMTMWL